MTTSKLSSYSKRCSPGREGEAPLSASRVGINQNNQNRLWVLPLLLGLLFGLVSIQHSLRQGQLSVPITYDDIGYFSDALARLQSIYDHGWLSGISDYIADPPHSPFSTFVAFVAFALFGVKDWGPAAINVLLVVAVLAITQYRLKNVGPWVFTPIAIAILCWPLMGALVIESRPDIVCALLTACAVLSIVGRPWLDSSLGHKFRISCLVGLAVLAKPSISPLTIFLYFAAITLASIGELVQGGRRLPVGKVMASNFLSIAVIAAISLTYFAVGWQHVYSYIKATEAGSASDVWKLRLDVKDAALYYLTGEGGKFMGPWLLWTVITLVFALLVGMATKYKFDSGRIVRVGAITSLVYLCVTIPEHKSTFIGVIVTCGFFVMFVEGIAFIVERLLADGKKRLLAVLLIVLTLVSVSSFQWHWYSHSGGFIEVEPAAASEQRKEVLTELGREIATHSKRDAEIFFTGNTQFLNAATLNFEFLRKGYRGLHAFDDGLRNQMSEVEPSLKKANFIITFSQDTGDLLRWLPNATILQAQNDAIRQESDLKLLKTFPSPSGVGTIMLYQR